MQVGRSLEKGRRGRAGHEWSPAETTCGASRSNRLRLSSGPVKQDRHGRCMRSFWYHAEIKRRMESMPHYFFLLDGAWFHEQLRPALAASWREKSLQPCQALCGELAASAHAFAESYHASADGSLVAAIAAGLPFDRNVWRGL